MSVAKAILLIVSTTVGLCHAQDSSHLVKNTDGRLVKCPYATHSCEEWIIDWRTPGGTIWGIDSASTEEGVKKQRNFTIEFERSYARFMGIEMDPKYLNPSEPYCKRACGKGSMSVKVPELHEPGSEIHGRLEGMWLAAAWRKKVLASSGGFIKTVLTGEPSKGLPNTKFGSVTREYASTLKKIRETVMSIERFTRDFSIRFSSIAAKVDAFKVDVDNLGSQLFGSAAVSEVHQDAADKRAVFRKQLEEEIERRAAGASAGRSLPAMALVLDWGSFNTRIQGDRIIVDERTANQSFHKEVLISALDLKAVYISDLGGEGIPASIRCRNREFCVSGNETTFTGTNQPYSDLELKFVCRNKEECNRFIQAIREAGGK